MTAHEHLPLVIVIAGDLVGGRENLVHRCVEPAIHAGANQLAADEQDEDGRHECVGEQEQDELGAKPGKRQGAAPLDHQLDDIARQHEPERHEHRQVAGEQRVENDLAQKIGRETG